MRSASTGQSAGFVVCVERQSPVHHRYVVARMRRLDDAHWDSGEYFTDDADAMAHALVMAGWRGVVREHRIDANR
jgi:hypothetical protein